MGDRQHIIPQLYLKHFTDANGNVWTYRLSGETTFAAPANTAVESYFYSYRKPDGSVHSELDDWLTLIEGLLETPYNKLLTTCDPEALTTEERVHFSYFVSTMIWRTRGMREAIGEAMARSVVKGTKELALNDEMLEKAFNELGDNGKLLDQEQKTDLREQLIFPSKFTMHIPKEHSLIALGERSMKLSYTLYEMNWTVIKAKHGFFITSDNPVSQIIHPGTKLTPGKFLNSTGQVTLPLNPYHLLVISYVKIPNGLVIGRDMVDKENSNRIECAHQEFYAHLHHKTLERKTKLINSGPRLNQSQEPKPIFKTPRRWDWSD